MTDDLDTLWLARGDVDLDVDHLVAEIRDEAGWIDPVPQYEDLVARWPDCSELQ